MKWAPTAAAMLGRTAVSRAFTSHQLSKNVTFYMNELATPEAGCQPKASQDHKPLTLILPWLGSRPQAIAKYCEIYLHRGFDVLVVETEVKQFLWPKWGLAHGKKLLDLLQSEQFASRPLLIHAFSIGGYTYTQLLVHVSQDTQKYQGLLDRIKGQVYDSLVVGSLDTMATGVGKTTFPRWETLIKRVSLLYFSIFKRQTVDYFNMSIKAFWNSPVITPALFFFCENDPLSDPRATEEVIDFLQKRGINITAKKWVDSKHAGHLKKHPQEYLSTLDLFLQSLQILPMKAKM